MEPTGARGYHRARVSRERCYECLLTGDDTHAAVPFVRQTDSKRKILMGRPRVDYSERLCSDLRHFHTRGHFKGWDTVTKALN